MRFKSHIVIVFIMLSVLLLGCFWKDKPIPPGPPKDPNVEKQSLATREAIEAAVKNALEMERKSHELKGSVVVAKEAVDDMKPIVDQAKADGGPAGDVGKKIDPLQKTAASNLNDASKQVDELQGQNKDLQTNLTKSQERIKLQDASIDQWKSDMAAHKAADEQAAITNKKEMDARDAKIRKLEEDNECWYAYIKYAIFLISLGMTTASIVVLLWLKERWVAAGLFVGALALPVSYFILRTVFKLEKPIMIGFGIFFCAALLAGVYYIWKYRMLLVKSVIGFDFQKDKTWDGDTKPIMAKIVGSSFDEIEAIKEEFIKHDKAGNIIMPNNTVIPVSPEAASSVAVKVTPLVQTTAVKK